MRFDSSPAPRALLGVTLLAATTFAALHGGVSPASADPMFAREIAGSPLPLASRAPVFSSTPPGVHHHLVLVDPIVDENASGGPVLRGQVRNECPNGNVRAGSNSLGIYENGELLGSIPLANFEPGTTKPFVVKLLRRPASQTLNIGSPSTGGVGKTTLSPFAIRRTTDMLPPPLHAVPTPTGTFGLAPHTEILILPPCD